MASLDAHVKQEGQSNANSKRRSARLNKAFEEQENQEPGQALGKQEHAKKRKKSEAKEDPPLQAYRLPDLSALPSPSTTLDAYGRLAPEACVVHSLSQAGTEFNMQMHSSGGAAMRLRVEALLSFESYFLHLRVSTINPSNQQYTLRVYLSAADVGLKGSPALVYDFEMHGICTEEQNLAHNLHGLLACNHCIQAFGYGQVLGRHAVLLAPAQASLRQLVASQGSLPELLARRVLAQVLAGSVDAHSMYGSTHRNLSMGNILLAPNDGTHFSSGKLRILEVADNAFHEVIEAAAAAASLTAAATDGGGSVSAVHGATTRAAAAAAASSSPPPTSVSAATQALASPYPVVLVAGACATSAYQGANGQPAAPSKAAPYSRHAPEVDAGQAFSTDADMYAAGMLLLEMLTGKDPFAYLRESATAHVGLHEEAQGSHGAGAQGGPDAVSAREARRAAARDKEYERRKGNAAFHLLDVPTSPFYGLSARAKLFLRDALNPKPSARPKLFAGRQHPYFCD